MTEIPRGGAGGLFGGGAIPQGPVSVGRAGDAAGEGPASRATSVSGARTFGQPSLSGSPKDQTAPAQAEEKLGVGGTSPAAEGDSANEPGGLPGGGKAAVGVAAAVPATAVAAQAMVLMAFINYLKGLAMAALALAQNLWHLAVGMMLAVGKNLMGGVLALGGAVSSALGGAVSAVAAGVTTATAGVAAVALVIVSAVTMLQDGGNVALRDAVLANCQTTATRALDSIEGSDGAVDQQTLLNAQVVYSVLAAWGMPDENVAGILGNWDAESGIDPTSVQNIFTSPQLMNDQKRTAAANTDNGIGLGQWTFGRNSALQAYAATLGKDWWTLEVQLGFMLSAGEGGNADVVRDMISRSLGTPADAAIYFHDEWERSADTSEMAARRADKANKWMGLFSGWAINQALADSILAQAGTTIGDANTGRAAAVRADCRSVGQAGVIAKEGGLNLVEAQQLMALYRVEGELFLRSRYGAGGPGDCGFGKADNCVGFSTYFVNKYTSFQQYPFGHGRQTAFSIAAMTGKETSNIPTPYSVASGPSSVPEGHTFVVLGIQGNMAIIGEAQCGSNHRFTQAKLMPLSELTNGSWTFVDVSDLVTETASA